MPNECILTYYRVNILLYNAPAYVYEVCGYAYK